MYAIVKTGGKQYRVQEGQHFLVERLPGQEGDTIALTPLLIVDGDKLADGDALAKATVSATILAHERGPKLRVVKFRPKRGYKRRTGHRQDLTRIQISTIKLSGTRSKAAAASEPKAAATSETPATKEASDGS